MKESTKMKSIEKAARKAARKSLRGDWSFTNSPPYEMLEDQVAQGYVRFALRYGAKVARAAQIGASDAIYDLGNHKKKTLIEIANDVSSQIDVEIKALND